jgi:hypothetical protein
MCDDLVSGEHNVKITVHSNIKQAGAGVESLLTVSCVWINGLKDGTCLHNIVMNLNHKKKCFLHRCVLKANVAFFN